MHKLRHWFLPSLSVAVIFCGTSAYGQTFPTCFSKNALELVKAVMSARSAAFPERKDVIDLQYEAIGFKDISTEKRTGRHVSCKLTAIDKKTGEFRTYLTYAVGRLNNSAPYVIVYF